MGFNTALDKMKLIAKRLQTLATEFPQQTLLLLRQCTGVAEEHLLRLTSNVELAGELCFPTIELVKSTTQHILQVQALPESVWQLISMPSKFGGLGIRDPRDEWSAASLSCAYSVAEKVGELTSSDEYMNRFLRTTKAHYTSQSGKSPDNLHGNFVCKHQMVEAIYNRKFLRLLDQATPVEAVRLQSLRTPHATAWVTSPPFRPQNSAAGCGGFSDCQCRRAPATALYVAEKLIPPEFTMSHVRRVGSVAEATRDSEI